MLILRTINLRDQEVDASIPLDTTERHNCRPIETAALTGEVESKPEISLGDGLKSDSTSKVWLGVFGVCSRAKFGLNG